MARMAVIRDGGDEVSNVIVADPSFKLPGFFLVESDTAGPGWLYVGGKFLPPPPKPPEIPQKIVGWKWRTVMKNHDLVANIEAFIKSIPDKDTRNAADSSFNSSDAFARDDKLLNYVMAGIGKTSAEVDAYFIEADAIEG